jgi:hypothetical protein
LARPNWALQRGHWPLDAPPEGDNRNHSWVPLQAQALELALELELKLELT